MKTQKKTNLHLAQQDVYYAQLLKPESPLYNIGGYVSFKGRLDTTLFKKVLSGLPTAFDIFNMAYDFTNEVPLCYQNKTTKQVVLNELDFSQENSPYETAHTWMQSQFNTPFDLHGETLYKFALLKINDQEYWWFMCFHHLLTDGYGCALNINYVLDTYKQELNDNAINSVDFPLYQAAIENSMNYLSSEQYQKDAAYWKEKFSTIPKTVLTKKNGVQTTKGGRYTIDISKEDRLLLESLSQKTAANISQFSIAALLIYFGKTTQHDTICIGTPIHNRGSRKERNTLGIFSSILPFKATYNEEQTVIELLNSIKKEQRNDYRHRSYPIAHLNRALQLLSENRLQVFDITVNYELLQFSKSLDEDLHTEMKNLICTQEVLEPLSFRWSDYGTDASLTLNIDYQTAYFNETEIAFLAERFLHIIRQFDALLQKKVHQITCVPVSELALLSSFNNTSTPVKEENVITLFEAQAKSNPENIAVRHGAKTMSYQELHQASSQVASYLKNNGLQANELVGICTERGFEMLIGILGILKAGGAYVPISPDFPKNRIEYIIQDADINFLLVSTKMDTITIPESLKVIDLKTDWQTIVNTPIQSLPSTTSETSLAYAIYTSGSTGNPKGVLVGHSSLANYIQYQTNKFNIDASEKIVQFSNFVFDASVEQLFLAFTNGAALVLVSKDTVLDTTEFCKLLKEQHITHLHATPSYLSQLKELGNCTSLKRIVSGGEVCTLDFAKRIPAGVSLYNKYGPTEATITVTEHQYNPLSPYSNALPIGKPIDNAEIYILNTQHKIQPIGVPGELCISGNCLSFGYLNNPELTKEKFIKHPFKNNQLLYKTGDTAKWLADGTIEFIGRLDDQVKIRGYRIELGEIETAISNINGVQNSCVLAKKDTSGVYTLVAYLVYEQTTLTTIQEKLQEILPEYMIPTAWVELDTIPLTPNGKIDKKTLPEPTFQTSSNTDYVAPRSDIEEQLATLWQKILGIEQVGVYDNFFKLGGHSILVIKLISHLKSLGYTIEVKDIFNQPTIDEICKKLSSTISEYTIPANGILEDCTYITPNMVPLTQLNQKDLDYLMDTIPNGAENIQDIYPLSPLQEGILFHHLLGASKQQDAYLFSCLFSFKSSKERLAFINALQKVINRHDVLRTCVLSNHLSQPVQVVQREAVLPKEELILEGEQEILAQLKTLITPGKQWMDVSTAPLLNVKCAEDTENGVYYLILNQHHLVSDHVGLDSMISEINILLSGEESKLQTPTLYRNFIGQIQHQQSLDSGELYFKELYKNIDEPSYPFNLSDVQTDINNIVESDVFLPKELSLQLRNTCKALGVSPAVFFHAAFGIVVSQCSHTEYALFGSLFSGRLQGPAESANSLGLHINTLPFLTTIQGTVLDYITQVNTNLQNLLPYEQTSMATIHNWSSISNNTPLVSAVLNFRHSSEQLAIHKTITLGTSEVTIVDAYERSNYPFSLNVDDYGNDFKLNAQVDSSFEPNRLLDYMLEALQNMLTAISEEEDTLATNINIIPKKEQQHLIHTLNDTYYPYPDRKTLVDVFTEQVKKTPEAIALVYAGTQLTYQELDAKSSQLAHYLKAHFSIPVEAPIAVVLERSEWLIISFLAVLKTGGAYVPIDPAYPEARKQYIKNDSHSKIIINEELVATFQQATANYPSTLPETNISSENLAYIIYTSGSTGQPKGVMIEHKSIMNTIYAQIDGFSIHKNSRCLQFASASFDASISEILGALLSGSSLYIIEESKKSDVSYFTNFINKHRITVATIPPAYLQLVPIEELKGMETLVSAGESISLELAKEVSKSFNYVNAYGPTETSVCASLYNEKLEKLVPIGAPINNTQIYILNKQNMLVPTGVIGELCVGGAGLARGYLNKPELTEEKFIQNPFNSKEKLYKTGDLARWLPEGNLEFMGRIDDQVKIRGYRIELGEVDNAISSIPGVVQHCVTVSKDKNNNASLTGYVVLESYANKKAIQQELKSKLPEYMIPLIWIQLDAMPLTTNGKIDKKALPKPEENLVSSEHYVAPRNETENRLAIIWQELLGVKKVGIHDDFFELGGHSLVATRLVSKIRTELNFEVAIRDVFEHKSIANFSDFVLQQAHRSVLPSVTTQKTLDKIPLSFSQERLWFLDQLQGTTEYHMPFVIKLEGALNILALDQSLKHIVKRHQTLRTLLVSEHGNEYQHVISEENWVLTQEMNTTSLEDSLKDFIHTPFDLSKDYKMRAKIYKTNSHYVLACVFHHIAGDGWSKGIFIDEFTACYNAYLTSSKPTLEPLQIQYTDYAIWQRKYLEGSVINNQLSYWEQKLADVPSLTLPADYPRTLQPNNQGAAVSMELDTELTASIQRLCKEEDVTLFMLLLTTFKVLLSRYSNLEDVCIGTPIANRTQTELEQMIGFFVNTLALRSDLSGNPTFTQALQIVKQTTLEGYDHQLAPFEKVVNKVISDRDMSITPLFQVLFSLQNTPEEVNALHLQDVQISEYPLEKVSTKFDLTLDAYENNGIVRLDLGYRTDLFKAETANKLLTQFKNLLQHIVANRTQSIQQLSLLNAQEEDLLLNHFNDTQFEYPKEMTIAKAFELQVTKTPLAIAVQYHTQTLTYQELHERSNQVAHFLLKKGIKADDFVGICLNRSLEMVIGILGILKAGGAYVPIDAEYPEKRIQHILQDTKLQILLTDEQSASIVKNNPEITSVTLDSAWEEIAIFSKETPTINQNSSNLAYVIYTSGSTGTPKGVMIEHRAVLNLIHYQTQQFDITNQERILQFSNYVFDASVEQLFLALFNGATLVLIAKELVLNPDKLVTFIQEEQITHLHATPSYLGQLKGLEQCNGLERIIAGGESCSLELAKKLSQIAPFYNEYGPTETTVTATELLFSNPNQNKELLSIGKPLGNTEVYILNSQNQLQPIGALGELCIGGDGLARGYLNQPELTAEKFIPHPFKTDERIYKTGDVAKWLPNGTIEFVGRIDDQVKIRGYRIELGEIENALLAIKDIQNGCVLAKKDANNFDYLVGYVVFHTPINKNRIVEELKKTLPDYMIPKVWIAIDALPLTVNGKLDKKALPEVTNAFAATHEYIAPRSVTEKQLSTIWTQLLGVETIGINDNFFELGGHSLLATRLASIIRDELAVDIAIRELFEHPTIESLATLIDVFKNNHDNEKDEESYNEIIEI